MQTAVNAVFDFARKSSRRSRVYRIVHALGEMEISVAVVDDAAIRRLSRVHLGRDHVTDVLSWDLSDSPDQFRAEIVVNADRAKLQAGNDWKDEAILYVVHGLMHLLGYDDRTGARRRRMADAVNHVMHDLHLTARM